MEEIFKNIVDEINFIKEQQNKLDVLTQNSKEVQDELKKLEQEQNTIMDKESGFYKDLQKKVDEKEKEFRKVDIERMNKCKEIDKLTLEKKKSILEKLEEKKKYIDDNRDANIVEKLEEAKKMESRKEEIEAIVERDTKNGVPDNDQIQKFRRKKIDDLNFKLEEVNNFNKLLNGQTPKEKFMEIESLIKMVEDNFDKDGFDKILDSMGEVCLINSQEDLDKEEQEEGNVVKKVQDKDKFEKKYTKTEPPMQKDINNRNMVENPNLKNTGISQDGKEKNKIILDVSANKINFNGNDDFYYKEEFKNRKNIDNDDYELNNLFYDDKKSKKNIDYALVSMLEKVDKSLVKAYLNIIRDGDIQSEETMKNIEKLNNAVNIQYKFNKEYGVLLNLKEKRIARNAKKLGIASLDGISEKSIFDKIKDGFNKFRNKNLLNGKEKIKALTSGKNTKTQEQKRKISEIIKQDRKLFSEIKIDNKDNKIEKNALDKQTETQKQLGKEVTKMMEEESKDRSDF